MAAVVVTAQNERLADAESETGWNGIGGGAGLGLESDYFYQGSNCIARKGVSTGPRGFFFAHTVAITSSSIANPTVILCAADHDLIDQQTVLIAGHAGSTPSINGTHVATVTGANTFTIPVNVTVGGTGGSAARQTDISGGGTYNTVMFKVICTTPGLIETLANDGFQVGIGSGASDHFLYDLHGSDTYPPTSSWLIVPVDPNVSAYRDETDGTPDLTAANYYALEYDQTATSQGTNQGMDAVDIGAGLTLVGGDGGDADGVWADFLSFDEGTINNRFGYVSSFNNVTFVIGRMIFGTATATVFNDSFQTIVFPDGLFAQGFSGITIDLQNATTDINFFNIQFLGKGSATTEETRPQLLVTGILGVFDATACLFDAFDTIILTSASDLVECVFVGCNEIDCGDGADLARSTIAASTAAINSSAIIWDANLDPDGFLDGLNIIRNGAILQHAVEFGLNSPLTMTIRDMGAFLFSASNNVDNSTFHIKRTTGTVTINVINGVGNFSYRTDGATVVIVVAAVTTLVNVKDDQANNLQNARVILEASNNAGDLPFEDVITLTRSGTTATAAHTAHGLDAGQKMVIRGSDDPLYNGVFAITNVSANAYDYTMNGTPAASPATGTITASGVILEGLTDASGNISDSRSISLNTPVKGFARKSTSSPRFKSFLLAGTVDSVNGLTINIRLILDE